MTKLPSDFDHMLVVGTFASGGRTPCPTDPLAYQMVEGTFQAPKVDDTVLAPGGGERKWKDVKAGTDGWIATRELNSGYAFATVDSDRDKVMVLDASGHSMVYVNGIPRGGDPYGFGFVQLPVELKKGKNEFLFSVSRGRVRANLVPPSGDLQVTALDPTFPDAIVGEDKELLCSVLVMNSTMKTVDGEVRSEIDGRSSGGATFRITPMTVKKVAFSTPSFDPKSARKLRLKVTVEGTAKKPSAQEFDIESKLPDQLQKRTFRSSIDGSVQYYGVQPASRPGAKALVLSLHGAGVEAIGQAASYGQKPWCHIVCPTNGRPYGYDWEDWGRVNALETLEEAKRVFQPDKDRIYLTGHSMGGHGTWSVGFNNSDQFAAIAPCAGWVSFWSYAGAADWKEPDPIEVILRRAANSSDTLKLLDNARNFGIYIQHGEKDDNVPVEQAREMRKRLAEFHKDFDWHEEPGQSHWFDTDPEAGANVQDYAPLFDFLARHRLQNDSDRRIWDVTTVNPDGTSKAANVEIVAQERSLEPSRLTVRTFADGSYEEVTTTNVKAVRIVPLGGHKKFKVKLDGADMEIDLSGSGNDWDANCFVKSESGWKPLEDRAMIKNLSQEGGIKACFGDNVVCVYGTGGQKDEKSWAYNKARFDAETWWYRGNGSLDLEPDSWKPSPSKPLPSVVFYGNTRTNAALAPWAKFGQVRAKLPFGEESKELIVGGQTMTGDLGLLWACSGFKATHIGIVGGTTLKGCRSVERLPLFLSGVHYADVFVNGPKMYLNGSKGVVATGFFAPDWSMTGSDFARRD